MKPNPRPNGKGVYFYHLPGGKKVNLRTTNQQEAVRLAKESHLPEMAHAAKVNMLSQEAFQRLTIGRKITVARAVSEWKEWLALRRRSVHTIERYVGDVERFVGSKGGELVGSLPAKSIDAFVNSDVSASTRACRHAALRSFFGFCQASGYRNDDPSRLTEVTFDGLTHDQKEPHRKPPFSDVEMEMLGEIDDPFWKSAVLLGDAFGLRLSDVALLEWASFSTGRFVFYTEKTNTRVEVEIPEHVKALLESLPRLDPIQVFPLQAAILLDPKRRATLSVQFGRLLSGVGIANRSFHCLRRRFATRHAGLGASVDEIRQKMGHASTAMTERYICP